MKNKNYIPPSSSEIRIGEEDLLATLSAQISSEEGSFYYSEEDDELYIN